MSPYPPVVTLFQHLYRHPQRLAELQQAATAGQAVIDQEKALEDFFVFYEDLYMEFSKFGRIDALHVCDNLGEILEFIATPGIPNARD